MNPLGLATQEERTTIHDLSCIRTGITDAKKDFPRLYDFYSGKCHTESFHFFLAIGDFYIQPLTRKAWRHTIFKEIDRLEELFNIH